MNIREIINEGPIAAVLIAQYGWRSAFLFGAFIIGSMAGVYSLAPILYPAGIRTTGNETPRSLSRTGRFYCEAFRPSCQPDS